jgi:hypothetical protein
MKKMQLGMAMAICILLVLGCREKITIPVDELTQDGYFTLLKTKEKGRYGPVVIFPERHDSRLIQAEISWALEILSESCGMNSIALEGMYSDEIMTGEKSTYNSTDEKYAVLLAQLESGGIKAPEFMYLAKDNRVFGIESKSEYAVDISDEANKAYFHYLLLSIVIDQGIEKLETIDDNASFNTIISLNPWTKETDTIINYGKTGTETIERLQELEQKVGNLADDKTRAAFKQFKQFFETSNQRSLTMAGNVYNTLRKENTPLSMIIGVAHTDDIVSYFDQKKVKYYVFEPRGLNADGIWSDLTAVEYERKNAGKPLFEDKYITQFFMAEKNSRPTFDKVWAKKELDVGSLIYNMIDLQVSGGSGFPPTELARNGFRVISESIKVFENGDIMFSIQNTKRELLHVYVTGYGMGYQFVSLKKALSDMVHELSKSSSEIQAFGTIKQDFGSMVEIVRIFGRTVYLSSNIEALQKIQSRAVDIR